MALLGIFALIILNQTLEPPTILISEISPRYLNQEIKVQGTIQSIASTPGLYIITLKQNNATIPIIAFRNQNVQLNKDTQVEVRGSVSKYQNSLEILAEEIKYV